MAKVEALLKPLEKELHLKDWFRSSQAVLKNLMETYRGNPDKDWWSRIMDRTSIKLSGLEEVRRYLGITCDQGETYF